MFITITVKKKIDYFIALANTAVKEISSSKTLVCDQKLWNNWIAEAYS